jgi:UBX domain-containing protein 6
MSSLSSKLKAKLRRAAIDSGLTTAPKAFAGAGHKLGTGEPKVRAAPPLRCSAAPDRDLTAAAAPQLAPPPRPPPPAPRPAPPPPPRPQPQPASQPQAREPPPPPAAVADVPPAARAAAAALAADPLGAAAAPVLARLLRNAATGEARFARLRLGNPKITAAVVEPDGGVELLQAAGFAFVFERPEAGPSAAAGGAAGETPEAEEEAFAVLPPDADAAALRGALAALALAALLPPEPPALFAFPPETAAPAPAAPPAPAPARPPPPCDAPIERRTRVILPASPATDLPSWFFERTGAELKAAFTSATKRREAEQTLMTRATRERLARGAARPPPAIATVRVRLPEGLAIQGEFGVGEPVAAVFGWLAAALADPLQSYDLVGPDRQPLKKEALRGGHLRVGAAGLAPATTLNLRWTGDSAAAMAREPALRAELLREARGA